MEEWQRHCVPRISNIVIPVLSPNILDLYVNRKYMRQFCCVDCVVPKV